MRRSSDMPDRAVQLILDELASVPVLNDAVDKVPSPPSNSYEALDVAIGSATVKAEVSATKWGVYEVSLIPTHGVAAQSPCRETSGFFLPGLTVIRDNE